MNKVVLLAGVLISGIGAFAAPQAVLCDPLEWLYADSPTLALRFRLGGFSAAGR